MCGITGYISRNGSKVTRNALAAMTDCISHRGPDGFGYYENNGIGFGHRRLSILDLSDSGAQPMYFAEKYVIVFNGEIYNYIEIRDELIRLGYSFHSGSDTEVILAAYDRWKEDCVSRFNGMWGFAIHDKEKNIIFCSRDRFGVKPFYYSITEDAFLFGSEIKSLLVHQKDRKVNDEILANYLIAGFEEYNEETFFKAIRKLSGGHNLIYNLADHTFHLKKYYTLQVDQRLSGLNLFESKNLFENELLRSISYRLRSDVKVGTCLSGGVDSSTIAAISAVLNSKHTKEAFNAFTAISSEKESREDNYAKMVVDHSHLNWHTVSPTADDFISILDEVIKLQEEPFGGTSVFMQYFVFKQARENGCIVMLDGQGGDETLLGYERYYATVLLSENWFSRIIHFFKSSQNSKLSKKDLLFYLFYFSSPSIRKKYLLNRSSFYRNDFASLLDDDLFEELGEAYRDPARLSIFEMTKLQLPHLLRYEDRNSMRHSVESRLPFLDYKLVETSLSLPVEAKMHDGWTKFVLRKTLEKYAPQEIAWRKSKLGFNAPERSWLDVLEPDMKEAVFNSAILKKVAYTEGIERHWNQLPLRTKWKLFNVAKWESAYNVS